MAWAERLLMPAGAFVGIALTSLVGRLLIGEEAGAAGLLPAMGASAVLFYGAPSSPLARPWPAIAGNLVSAIAGVAVAAVIPEPTLAAASAVALALAAMSALGCLHPPGGAVALLAVVGGPAVREAGFAYVLTPVAVNAFVMFGVAWAYNRVARRG